MTQTNYIEGSEIEGDVYNIENIRNVFPKNYDHLMACKYAMVDNSGIIVGNQCVLMIQKGVGMLIKNEVLYDRKSLEFSDDFGDPFNELDYGFQY